MKIHSKLATGAAIATLGIAGVAASAQPSAAIVRDVCNDKNLTIYSDVSTCWAHLGDIDVNL